MADNTNGILVFLAENEEYVTMAAAALAAFAVTGIKSFMRRPGKTSQGGVFFTDGSLLKPPKPRPAYSDRMAYILAELSALAYFRFEVPGDGAVQETLDKFLKLTQQSGDKLAEEAGELLKNFRDELLVNAVDSREVLEKILKQADFELLDTIDVGDTQAFACKRVKEGEPPYVVIAFRGTEMELGDWLTDLHAKPDDTLLTKGIKMHSGFWKALNHKPDEQTKNVLERVIEICGSDAAKDGERKLPCYFTGHSLGGALALIATRELASDIEGACFTYGAPRVANYQYFKGMKTPVYRVVNSSDIVPRVPPGAIMGVVLKIVQAVGWLAQAIPGAKQPLEWLEQKVDQLNGYRHHGDQRYLTDVKSDSCKDLHLLTNPPAIDRIWWMWQHMGAATPFVTVKSHGMAIYRRKLMHIAKERNTQSEAAGE